MMRYVAGALRRWLRFYLNASTIYDIHSPFVARLIHYVVEDKRWYYAFSDIESRRRAWKKDETPVVLSTLGAGSMVSGSQVRTAGELLSSNAVDPETGRRLFRLVFWSKPKYLVELGTAQGISTAYMASAGSTTQFYTLEGNRVVAEMAQRHLAELNMTQVKPFTGNFRDRLPALLEQLPALDFLFVDGDHTENGTLHYYRLCVEKRTAGSVFVFADIHWTDEMERTWRKLCAMPEVTLSIDLFHLGLLFFNPDIRVKQHYAIVPSVWKPWRMGLWGR
jgi:predicted O-methyltransferase YrrM